MKTMKKALLFMLCAALVVSATVFGTLAYLTDTEAVTNTFTVGQIAISLDEADVNEAGQKLNAAGEVWEEGDEYAARVQANEYHLLPGCTYSKDPIVHVDPDSEDSYIFIKVDNNGIEAIEETAAGYTNVAAQIAANGWIWWKNEGNVHYFYQEYTKDQDKTDLAVFQQFKVGDFVTNEQLKAFYDAAAANNNQDKAVIVTAYAIQKTGFASPAEAWEAGNKPADQGGWLENQPQNP